MNGLLAALIGVLSTCYLASLLLSIVRRGRADPTRSRHSAPGLRSPRSRGSSALLGLLPTEDATWFAAGARATAQQARNGSPPRPRLICCECSEPGCTEQLELTASLAEALARRPECFILKPGHERAQIEQVVETHASYLLTETR